MRVGIIGAGGMGNVHARHYARMSDVELLFLERDNARAGEFERKYSARRCDTAKQLVDQADIVDVCLPSDLHTEFALRAIAAGKATLVEKPIAPTLEDAAKIVDAADFARVPLGTAQVVRYFPEYRSAHNLVEMGKVGTPAAVRMRRGGAAPGRGSDNWFMDHKRSGGVLVDLGVHEFDWLRWTLGEVEFLYSRSLGAETMSGPDYALTVLTFKSGVVAHVESTWMDPSGFRTTLEVAGSGGIIEFDSWNSPALKIHARGKSVNESPLAGSDDPFYRELSDFVGAVKSGTPPPVSGVDGMKALGIALAALQSAKTGKLVRPAEI